MTLPATTAAVPEGRASAQAPEASTETPNSEALARVEEGDNKQLHRQASISETVELTVNGWHAPRAIRWFEVLFRMKDPGTGKYLPEGTGWAMDSCARGPLNQIGQYIGPALIALAAQDAGCGTTPVKLCKATVGGGILPSSLLTLSSTVVGVIAAILMPVFGAIVDHTRHRKTVGIVSAFVLVLVTGLMIAISIDPNNWLFIFVLDAIQNFGLLVHATATFAYLPDLTLDFDNTLPKYTSHFNIRQFLAQLVVGGLVIMGGFIRNGNARTLASRVATARDGAGIGFAFGVIFFGYSWTFLFRKRPALSEVPEGSSLITTGFKQVFKTSKTVVKHYRALRWFMFSLLWSPEHGAGVVMNIVVTYFTVVMRLTSLDIAMISLVLMGGNILGAFWSSFVIRKARLLNPLNSYRAGMTLLGVSIGVAAGVLDGPGKANATYGFAVAWGFFMGWTYPSQRVLFVTLIPKGQETEFMGLFFFMGQILGWLPPLIFTALNERGVDMRWGLSVIPFFCILSVLCTAPMGRYEDATELAAKSSEARLRELHDKASKHENYSGKLANKSALLESGADDGNEIVSSSGVSGEVKSEGSAGTEEPQDSNRESD